MCDEIWMPVPGYEEFYQVSSFGRVRSEAKKTRCVSRSGKEFYRYSRQRILSSSVMKNGYRQISLNGKHLLVHRLVCMAFIRLPDSSEQVNHINGIKSDNRLENLEWCIPSQNIKHAYETGLARMPRGEESPNSKLLASDVEEIRKLIDAGYSQRRIAAIFNISQRAVSKINRRETWI